MEKKETNGDGPTTWAQAALTSLNNKANVVNTAANSKGLYLQEKGHSLQLTRYRSLEAKACRSSFRI